MPTVHLPAVIDLSEAATLAETLRAANVPIVLDGSGVERIGVAGLQLLLSAKATMSRTGGTFEIVGASGALQAAVRTAGADVLLVSDR